GSRLHAPHCAERSRWSGFVWLSKRGTDAGTVAICVLHSMGRRQSPGPLLLLTLVVLALLALLAVAVVLALDALAALALLPVVAVLVLLALLLGQGGVAQATEPEQPQRADSRDLQHPAPVVLRAQLL